MITPAPTNKIDPKLCRGVFEKLLPATSTTPEHVVISILDTSYQMHLIPDGPVKGRAGHRIVGVVRAKARRIDVVKTGGRYVEPVFGRPRRVQGTVIAIESGNVVVNAGIPIWVEPTDARQKAADFEVGQFVSFDALDGASFTQQG